MWVGIATWEVDTTTQHPQNKKSQGSPKLSFAATHSLSYISTMWAKQRLK